MYSRCSTRWRTNTSLPPSQLRRMRLELYEAATNNVQIQRAMKKHESNFPLAFAGVSHYVTGNLKTAAREIRKELLAEIRKYADARAVPAPNYDPRQKKMGRHMNSPALLDGGV